MGVPLFQATPIFVYSHFAGFLTLPQSNVAMDDPRNAGFRWEKHRSMTDFPITCLISGGEEAKKIGPTLGFFGWITSPHHRWTDVHVREFLENPFESPNMLPHLVIIQIIDLTKHETGLALSAAPFFFFMANPSEWDKERTCFVG